MPVFLLCLVLGILLAAASLLAAAMLIVVSARGGHALPVELQEESIRVETPPIELPQSAAGGLTTGEAVDG